MGKSWATGTCAMHAGTQHARREVVRECAEERGGEASRAAAAARAAAARQRDEQQSSSHPAFSVGSAAAAALRAGRALAMEPAGCRPAAIFVVEALLMLPTEAAAALLRVCVEEAAAAGAECVALCFADPSEERGDGVPGLAARFDERG